MIDAISMRVGTDVTLEQVRLTVVDYGVGISQVRSALATSLYLRTRKDKTGFKCLLDCVLVSRPSILSDELGVWIALRWHKARRVIAGWASPVLPLSTERSP
jgi:hypothetical protein